MSITMIIHANLPKRTWGWAVLLAIEIINRSAESSTSNTSVGAPSTASRLEKWHGAPISGQTKALYPFGCLAFKHVPAVLRNKLDAHALPYVYLGIDPASRSYLLGSLYDLQTTVAVEVTFFENVFPFRKFKANDSPASLLWGTDSTLQLGDPRLGMFDTGCDDTTRTLDKAALKSIGALPSSLPANKTYSLKDHEVAVQGEVENKTPLVPIVPEPLHIDASTNDPSLRRSTRERIIPTQTNQRYLPQIYNLWKVVLRPSGGMYFTFSVQDLLFWARGARF